MATIQRPFRGNSLPVHVPVRGINGWVLAAIAGATVSAMLPVLQNSTTTSRGFEVQDIQGRQTRIEGEIGLLESDVARLSSLARIQKRASEIGLVPASSPLYITVEEAGPAPAKIPAEYVPPPTRESDTPEGWWNSLKRWLPSLKP